MTPWQVPSWHRYPVRSTKLVLSGTSAKSWKGAVPAMESRWSATHSVAPSWSTHAGTS